MQSAIPTPRPTHSRPAAARALALVVRGTQVALALLGAVSWMVS